MKINKMRKEDKQFYIQSGWAKLREKIECYSVDT